MYNQRNNSNTYNNYGYKRTNNDKNRKNANKTNFIPPKELNDLTYVKEAERVINGLKKDPEKERENLKPTKNQIRNLLTLVNELYNKVRYSSEDQINAELQSKIQYVKMRMAYEGGRDDYVRDFLKNSNLLTFLDSIGDSKKDLIRLCHYMEAMVAYHRYYTTEK